MKEIKPGQDGMPPIKDSYTRDEKRIIAAAAAESGIREVSKVYGLKWQHMASWKRLTKNKVKLSEIVFQAPDGRGITPSEVLAKITERAEKVYVRVDENKAYWVRGKDNGSVDLW